MMQGPPGIAKGACTFVDMGGKRSFDAIAIVAELSGEESGLSLVTLVM